MARSDQEEHRASPERCEFQLNFDEVLDDFSGLVVIFLNSLDSKRICKESCLVLNSNCRLSIDFEAIPVKNSKFPQVFSILSSIFPPGTRSS
jgi:hypothetical protein